MEAKKSRKRFKMPTAFTILFFIIAFIILVSWILKWYNVSPAFNGHTTKIAALGIVDIFYSIVQGFLSKVDVIIFILCLGGFVLITLNSKSLEAMTQALAKKMKAKSIWLIPILMTFFSFCGSTFGMAEESLGFYMMLIPFMIVVGYDKLVGVMIVLFGAGVGCLASSVNPFVISVAVDAAQKAGVDGITTSDGMAFRWISWVILTTVSICLVMWYANRIRKNPQKSYVFDTMEGDKVFYLGEKQEEYKFTGRRIATLTVFLLTFVIMVIYMVAWDDILSTDTMEKAGAWMNKNAPYITGSIPGFGMGGLTEVAPFFLISGLIIAAINWQGEAKYVDDTINGARDLLGVCLVIAVAGGIGYVLETSHIKDLIVNGLVDSVGSMPKTPFVIVSFILFLPLSFVIPSTSGFAAAIFPMWGPTAYAAAGTAGVSGSIASFSFASGTLNLFTPTSGVVMGGLGIARLEWGKFMKVAWPFFLIMAGMSVVLLGLGSLLPSPIF
jgi:uncharacterized ion transporter superfamily protein YfcC